MTLKRTPSGLKNLSIFKGVNLIVYTEGGDERTLSKAEVLEGQAYENSDDIKFWKQLFQMYLPNIEVKVLAVGNSNTLKEIASEIVAANISNVCVAMDRDYSNYWGEILQHRAIVYTRTYSWENELFQPDVILGAFKKAAIEQFDEAAVRQDIEREVKTILKELRHFLKADIVLVAAKSSFFCRNTKKTGACFINTKKISNPLRVDNVRMRTLLQKKKKTIPGFRLINNNIEIDTGRDMYGKPLLFAARRILQVLISNANQPSLHNNYLDSFLLNSFFEWLGANYYSGISQTYSVALNNIISE